MKPIPQYQRGVRSIYNIPNPEPLVPGLRRAKQFTEAIGFTSSYSELLDEGMFSNFPGDRLKING
jgi:hypothetical protein